MLHTLKVPICMILAASFAVIAGCKENTTGADGRNDARNTPVLTSTTNSLTYAIDADKFTATASTDLSFTTDSISISLATGGYGGGSADLSIYNPTGGLIFRDSVVSNKAIVITQAARGLPARFTAVYTNFTGKVSLVVSRNMTGL